MASMFVDKPMKKYKLIQVITRVNRVYKDKKAGLIVDYIEMATDLKNALNHFTNDDQDKIPNISQAYGIV
jgi:type I restriction enzyme R subunit